MPFTPIWDLKSAQGPPSQEGPADLQSWFLHPRGIPPILPKHRCHCSSKNSARTILESPTCPVSPSFFLWKQLLILGFARGLRDERWLPSVGMHPPPEDYSHRPGASQEPDGRVLPRRSSAPPASTDLRKLACSLLLQTASPKPGWQTCWRLKMSTTSPGLQLKAPEAWPGTSLQGVFCGRRFLVTREREKRGKEKNNLPFLAKSFLKLIVSALGTRH